MAASRWHSNMIDLFDWISENDSALLDIFMPPLFPQIDQKTEKQAQDKQTHDELVSYPDTLPILIDLWK